MKKQKQQRLWCMASALLFLAAGPVTPARAGEVQTQEGCKIVTPGAGRPAPSAPSWSGECVNGLISGVGRYRTDFTDADGRRQVTEAWFEARSGWYALGANPYYYGSYGLDEYRRVGYWRSRSDGYTDQVSVADCRNLPGCNRILAKREETLGAEQNAGQSADGAKAAEQAVAQAAKGNQVDYAGVLVKAAAAAAAAKAGTTGHAGNTVAASPQPVRGTADSRTGGAAAADARPAPSPGGATVTAQNNARPSIRTTAPQASPQQWIEEPIAHGCVRISRGGGVGKGSMMAFLENSCPYKVAVNFCYTGPGVREGNCAANDIGLEWVRPNGRSTIAGPWDEGGKVAGHVLACKDPASPQSTGDASGIRGKCRRWGTP